MVSWSNPITQKSQTLPKGVYPGEDGTITTDPYAIDQNWQKGTLNQGGIKTQINRQIRSMIQGSTPETEQAIYNQALATITKHYMGGTDMFGMLLNIQDPKLVEETAKKHLDLTYGELNRTPPVFIEGGGERGKELIGKITVD